MSEKVINKENTTQKQSKKKKGILIFLSFLAIFFLGRSCGAAPSNEELNEAVTSCGSSCSNTIDSCGKTFESGAEAIGEFIEINSCAEGCTPDETKTATDNEISNNSDSEENNEVSSIQEQFNEMLNIYNTEYGHPLEAEEILEIFSYEIAEMTAKVYTCENEIVNFDTNSMPGNIFVEDMTLEEIKTKAIEVIKAEYEATNGNVGLINSDDAKPENIVRIYNAYVASQLLCGHFGLENNMSYSIEIDEKTIFDVNAEVVNALAIKLSEATKEWLIQVENSQSLENGAVYKLR